MAHRESRAPPPTGSPNWGSRPGGFHLVVARFEPENHVDVIVDGYRKSAATLPLIVVGSAPYADEYTRKVHALADDRVRFLGGVWDQELLDQLYANSFTYLHGHSVGGTNPSLLRALGAGAATTAFDVVFNREVLGDSGLYFSGADDVARLVGAERGRCRGHPRPRAAVRGTGIALRLGRRRRSVRGTVPAAGRRTFRFPLGAESQGPGRRGRQRRFLNSRFLSRG